MNESSNNFIRNIIIVAVAITLIIAFWEQRNNEVKKIIDENQEVTFERLSRKIKKEYRLDNGKPFIIYPQKDSILCENQIDSIQSKISKFLKTDFESLNDSLLKVDDFTPFYIFPNEPIEGTEIKLSVSDLENMKRHFEYIKDEFDNGLNASNEDLNRALENLDNRQTIWIGILGLIGIFIPIFLQFQTTSSTERIIDEKLNIIKDSHNKLDNDLNELITQYPTLKENAELAIDKTKQLEDLVFLIHNLGKLRGLDINKTQFVENKEEYFRLELEKIANSIEQIIRNEILDIGIIKEDLTDFYYTMNSFKFFFSNREFTENIENFISHFKDVLNSEELNINIIYDHLKVLIEQLKK